MRLLRADAGRLSLIQFEDDSVPPYAILSHTWLSEGEEVTYEEIKTGTGAEKQGYAKLRFCREQAAKGGLPYFWVDTCCIDRSSSADLTESIVSMFRWYRRSQKCYVYLSDVSTKKHNQDGSLRPWLPAFRSSRYWSRGWTLQELLAPSCVEFYTQNGEYLGNKSTLQHEIHMITHIPTSALENRPLSSFSTADRFRWAEGRKTKKPEDQSYCLMGLFDVSMPVVYGEGEKHARIRLDQQIAEREKPTSKKNDALTMESPEKEVLKRREILFKSLEFDVIDARHSAIRDAQSSTCDWLLQHPAYIAWNNHADLEKHHGFLRINGKPGAGKSTIMKFALGRAVDGPQEKEILLSHFFNARGDDLEKSTIGMYRALLLGLLSEAKDLQSLLDDTAYWPHRKSSPPPWNIQNLCKLFLAAIKRLGSRRLRCFVDALDECDEEQVREMIETFEGFGEAALEANTALFVCFSSRHYPNVTIRHGLRIVLEDELGHSEDIRKYVSKHLHAYNSPEVDEIKASIKMKANGVFMWTVLVVGMLKPEFDRGRMFAVKQKLQTVPEKLSDLFESIINRDEVYRDEMLLSLQLILFATRPLYLSEFYVAMIVGLRGSLTDSIATQDTMSLYVRSCSKGLAEPTGTGWFRRDFTPEEPRVQFIHESVRDYLLKDNGLSRLWPELSSDTAGSSHERLKDCCQLYLSEFASKDRPRPPRQNLTSPPPKLLREMAHPFLEYAIQGIFQHAEKASVTIPQNAFLNDFDLEAWYRAEASLHRTNHVSDPAGLLYMLATHDCSRLIKTFLSNSVVLGKCAWRYRYPLFAALFHGSHRAASALLGLDEHYLDGEFFHTWWRYSFELYETPLLWALSLESKYESLADTLSMAVDADFTPRNSEGRDSLSLAAERGYRAVCERILSTYHDVDLADSQGRTPLWYASRQGQTAVVMSLLGTGANPRRSRWVWNTTPLFQAAMFGHTPSLQALFEAVTKEDPLRSKRSLEVCQALCIAVEQGHEGAMKYLLDCGADPNYVQDEAPPGQHQTSLDRNPDISIYRSLDHKTTSGGTLLHCAVSSGYSTLAQILLAYKANVNATNHGDENALHVAVRHGFVESMEILLHYGISVDAVNREGETALHLSARLGRLSALQYLLSKSANMETQNKIGQTALHLAMFNHHSACAHCLIAAGASTDVVDTGSRSPFYRTRAEGHEDSVKACLTATADVFIPNHSAQIVETTSFPPYRPLELGDMHSVSTLSPPSLRSRFVNKLRGGHLMR